MKVRHFGFLSPTFAVPIDEVKARVEMAHGFVVKPAPSIAPSPAAPMACSRCGAAITFLRVVRPLATAPGIRPRSPIPALAAGP